MQNEIKRKKLFEYNLQSGGQMNRVTVFKTLFGERPSKFGGILFESRIVGLVDEFSFNFALYLRHSETKRRPMNEWFVWKRKVFLFAVKFRKRTRKKANEARKLDRENK